MAVQPTVDGWGRLRRRASGVGRNSVGPRRGLPHDVGEDADTPLQKSRGRRIHSRWPVSCELPDARHLTPDA